MRDYVEYAEQTEWQKLVPELEALERELTAKGVNAEDFLDHVFEVKAKDEFKEFIDPVTLGAGAYALKKGWDKLGGWQGIKNIAQAGAQGLKNTAQGVGAAYKSNQLGMQRQAAVDAAQRVGGTANLPTTDPSDPTNVQKWASSIDTSLQSMQRNASSLVNSDSEMRRLASVIQQATAAMQRRVGQLTTV